MAILGLCADFAEMAGADSHLLAERSFGRRHEWHVDFRKSLLVFGFGRFCGLLKISVAKVSTPWPSRCALDSQSSVDGRSFGGPQGDGSDSAANVFSEMNYANPSAIRRPQRSEQARRWDTAGRTRPSRTWHNKLRAEVIMPRFWPIRRQREYNNRFADFREGSTALAMSIGQISAA